MQGHKLGKIHDEYVQFAGHKQRKLDRMYIENFEVERMAPLLAMHRLRPPWFVFKIAKPSPTTITRPCAVPEPSPCCPGVTMHTAGSSDADSSDGDSTGAASHASCSVASLLQ